MIYVTKIIGFLDFIFYFCFQRGSDELLSQTNVSVMAPSAPHADNNNQENAKKVSKLQCNFCVGINRSLTSVLFPERSIYPL